MKPVAHWVSEQEHPGPDRQVIHGRRVVPVNQLSRVQPQAITAIR